MDKTRNFILAVLGFFMLSVVFFIFAEVVWTDRDTPAAVISVPTLLNKEPTATPVGDPQWLVPYDQIVFYCEHPWVIRRELPLLNKSFEEGSIDDLIDTGLSECYELAGEKALDSHLWYQGIHNRFGEALSSKQAKAVELFFRYDADFQALGLQAPETVDLSGVVVHDLNGDAEFNPGEPVISGAQICINREPLSPLCTYSGKDGRYRFNNILPGAWYFRVSSPSTERLAEFKYTNQPIEADHQIRETTFNGYTIRERYLNLTAFNPIEDEILLPVDQEAEQNFFLMQEWATYFAAPKDIDNFQITAYYDLDVRKGVTRIFNGEREPTYDQHDGLDASCPVGTEIVSVAEGRVTAILSNSTVLIQHTNDLISVYGHGDPLVEENQFVPRGYPVALCNNNLTTSGPHLHFAVWQNTPWLHLVSYGVPPFADLVITEEKWVVNKNPLETDYFVYLLQGSRGVWTEINQPHPPNVRLSK